MENQDVSKAWGVIHQRVVQSDVMSPHLRGHLDLAQPKGVLGDTLYIEVPSEVTRTLIQQRLGDVIREALQEVAALGGPSNFAVVTNELLDIPNRQEAIAPEFPEETTPVRPEQEISDQPRLFETSRLNPKYNFENFVTGHSNRFAHAAAFAVAESPAESYNPLFIYGSSGLGKTHLLHAIGHYATRLRPRLKVRYISSEEFTNEFINSIKNSKSDEFQNQYRNVDILLIDDIQFLSGKAQTQEAFFHIFNTLHDHNKQVVITSDLKPKELNGFEDRMLSRFEWGLLTDIQTPEFETRVAILLKKASNEGIDIPENAIEFMASRISSNIRELEGTLIRVTAYANLNKRPIDLELVQDVLKDSNPIGHDLSITALDIIHATAKYFQITPEEIIGSGRQQAIADARQIAMHICRELTDLSLPKIGQVFGGRDHTTVMYATKKINGLIRERRSLYNTVSAIIERLKDEKTS